MEIKSVFVLWICPTELPRKWIPIMCRWRSTKMEVQLFTRELGLEIFFLYHVINHLEKKFCAKNTLVASHSRAVIAKKRCWNVTFGHRFDKNFRKAINFWMPPECFRKYTFTSWIWTQTLHYFDGNQECYCPLNMSYRVAQKMDSNYVPMEQHKNGSLTIHSRIRLGNIFPISRDQSSRKKILCKKYVSG